MHRSLFALVLLAVSLALPAAAGAAVNGEIVYATDYRGDLYTVEPDGTNNTRITPTRKIEEEPEYSPDGGRIAYTRHPATKGEDLFVMNADGTGVTQLTSAKKPISSPVWTADGSRILFLTERDDDFNGAEIYSIEPDGTGETLLANDALTLSSPSAISTAAGRLVYTTADGADLAVMNLDGTGKSVLAPEPLSIESNPQLSPDGARIAFDSDRGAQEITRVYTIGVDGSGLDQLYSERSSLGGWSPDGTRLAITESLGTTSVLSADGTGRTELSRTGTAVEFSPDGTRVAIEQLLPRAGEDPFYRLFAASASGGRAKALTAKRDGAVYGDWRPLPAPSTDAHPELVLKARAERTRRPQAVVECSNECDVVLKAAGRIGNVTFSSRTQAHLYGADKARIAALGAKTAKALEGKRGTVEVTVRATDDFGQRERTTIEVRLRR